jgi:hypothetical protein
MLEDFGKILEERRLKECTGKKQYTSMQYAAKVRKIMEREFPEQAFDEYSCFFCGRFHVGHAKGKNPRIKNEHSKIG